MSLNKCLTLVLTLACCNLANAQQQADQKPADQSRREQRVEERRDQFTENREERQDNRDARQAERAADGRQLGDRIGGAVDKVAGNSMDQFIATCLLIGNQEEVALAKEAVSRARNENVKQFAQMLVDDHEKAVLKLQQHAKHGMGLDDAISVAASSLLPSSNGNTSNGSSNDATAKSTPGEQQIASVQSSSSRTYTANRVNIDVDPMATGALDKVLAIHKQAARECLSMTKSIMQEKQGVEFDKAFAGSQIGAHIGMLAKLKASQQQASPELASIIQESEQTVQKHLEHAKQLCEELESMHASNR